MIDLKDLRENPDKYRNGVRDKCMQVDVDRLLALDEAAERILADAAQPVSRDQLDRAAVEADLSATNKVEALHALVELAARARGRGGSTHASRQTGRFG